MKSLITNNTFYCPICGQSNPISEYLKTVFENNERMIWLSNMITHYRHNHITSWNKCWGYNGHRYRRDWFGDYDEEKQKVNERAKRQIIRKAIPFLKHHSIGVECFQQLEWNDEKTIELAQKKLVFK